MIRSLLAIFLVLSWLALPAVASVGGHAQMDCPQAMADMSGPSCHDADQTDIDSVRCSSVCTVSCPAWFAAPASGGQLELQAQLWPSAREISLLGVTIQPLVPPNIS